MVAAMNGVLCLLIVTTCTALSDHLPLIITSVLKPAHAFGTCAQPERGFLGLVSQISESCTFLKLLHREMWDTWCQLHHLRCDLHLHEV
jgi:hypothetical protein